MNVRNGVAPHALRTAEEAWRSVFNSVGLVLYTARTRGNPPGRDIYAETAAPVAPHTDCTALLVEPGERLARV